MLCDLIQRVIRDQITMGSLEVAGDCIVTIAEDNVGCVPADVLAYSQGLKNIGIEFGATCGIQMILSVKFL